MDYFNKRIVLHRKIIHLVIGEEIYLATPEMKETADQYYAGVRKVSFVQLPLLSVNAENAEETIFGNFEKLYLSNYSSRHQL